jgi:Protein of unknown function (DUF2973)
MLHLLYIAAFTIIAFITITNLIKSLVSVSFESGQQSRRRGQPQNLVKRHPELFDENGQPTDEPLLVIRSVNVEDARRQLDKLYQASSVEDLDS